MPNLYDTIGIIKNGNKTKLPVIIVENIDADGVAYDNTSSGLSATDVQGAIDELAPKGSVSVTADGVKTTAQLLNELYALVDASKANKYSKIERTTNTGVVIYNLDYTEANTYYFTSVTVFDTFVSFDTVVVKASDSKRYEYNSGSISDKTNTVPASGRTITLYY